MPGYYPTIEVVPPGPWRHLCAIRELDVVIMSIRLCRLPVRVTKSPIVMDREAEPIFRGNIRHLEARQIAPKDPARPTTVQLAVG